MRTGGTETFTRRVRALLDKEPDGLPAHVDRSLHVLDELSCQIKKADNELKELALDDPICARMMTVPGVGPLTSVRFLAAVDERERFGSSHSLESYFGLTPGENSSSERKMRTGITKAGCKMVRWTLVQAAWTAMRTRPNDPMVRWAQGVAARRGRKIAAVALARKIAGILYALWRDGTNYNPVLSTPADNAAEA
jgi:transposase